MIKPNIPMGNPNLIISEVFKEPNEYAKAFGGVETGKAIASEQDRATGMAIK